MKIKQLIKELQETDDQDLELIKVIEVYDNEPCPPNFDEERSYTINFSKIKPILNDICYYLKEEENDIQDLYNQENYEKFLFAGYKAKDFVKCVVL